jgi:hypothetical protein
LSKLEEEKIRRKIEQKLKNSNKQEIQVKSEVKEVVDLEKGEEKPTKTASLLP